jgi:hypothetical protein
MFWKKLFGSPVMPPEVGGRNYLRQKLAEAGRQLPGSCLDEIVRRVLRAIAEVPSILLEPALDIEVDSSATRSSAMKTRAGSRERENEADFGPARRDRGERRLSASIGRSAASEGLCR